MRSTPPPTPPPKATRVPTPDTLMLADWLWKLAVLLLLGWIAWNVQLLRKPEPAAPPAVTTTAQEDAR